MGKYESLNEKEIVHIISILKKTIKDAKPKYKSIVIDNELLDKLLFLDIVDINIETKQIDKYRIIRNNIYKYIRYFDLSNLSFENVIVSETDFSYCNANIDPQKVRDKDLSYGIYPLDFTNKSFDGAKITGSDFKRSKGVVIDTNTIDKNMSYGVYPIHIKGSIANVYIKCSDFTGAYYEKQDLREAVQEVNSAIRRVRY